MCKTNINHEESRKNGEWRGNDFFRWLNDGKPIRDTARTRANKYYKVFKSERSDSRDNVLRPVWPWNAD